MRQNTSTGLALLERTTLFRSLSFKQKTALAEIAVPCRFRRGAMIFRQGAESVGFYVLHSGAVNVHRITAEGKESVIRIFHAGESFAEASLLPSGVYPANARAIVDCMMHRIPRVPFLSLLKSDADFGLRMLVALSVRIHSMADSIASLRGENMRARVLHWLLSRRPPVGNPVSYTIHLAETKLALAAELGMRQETLSRQLTNLRKSGDLAVHGRTITVLKASRLHALLNEVRELPDNEPVSVTGRRNNQP